MASIFGVCCWYILYHKDKIGDIDTLVSYPLLLNCQVIKLEYEYYLFGYLYKYLKILYMFLIY